MIIKINGKDEVYEKKLDLFALIESKKLRAQHIVVEHNFHIVPQDMWKDIILKDNDSIEIVSFVSGG